MTYPVAEATLNTIELTEDAVRRLGIETQPLTERSMPRFRSYGAEAVLPAGASVIVSAPLAGTLRLQNEQKMLLPGQQVEKDSKLLELLPMLSPERDVLTPAERIRFAEVKNTIAQSQNDAAAQVQQCQVQLEAAQIALDRAERLLKDKSGTIRTVDEATAQLRLAEAALEAAKARKVIVDGIRLDAEAGTLQPIPIVAPMSGIVRSVQVQPGQITAAGSPMFEIMNTSTLWVRVPVYVGDLESVELTADAKLTAPGERRTSDSVSVKPIVVPPTAQALASTVDLYYELRNEEVRYQPGQRFSVQIRMTGDATVLAVPWAAVYLDIYGNQWIYEKTGDRTFVRRRVEVAFVADGWAALNHGPDPGVSVVTTGVAELAGTEFGFAK
ncbi:MAG: efflux RND transporter periplasmic adaptor subunit [Planctomycetaceae bacterium]